MSFGAKFTKIFVFREELPSGWLQGETQDREEECGLQDSDPLHCFLVGFISAEWPSLAEPQFPHRQIEASSCSLAGSREEALG